MREFLDRARAVIVRQPYHLLLPFTCVWVIKPFYQGSRFDWICLAIAWPCFVGLYVLAHAGRRFAYVGGLTGLSLLGALYVPVNPEASGVFAFAAAIYAASHPRKHVLWIYLAAVNLLLFTEAIVFSLNLWAWVGGGAGAVLFSLTVWLNARERETNLQLLIAQGEVRHLAKLMERERITRDLHDVLGHTLSLITLKSDLAQKSFAGDPEATLLESQQIGEIARAALARVRAALHGQAISSFRHELDRIVNSLESLGIRVECTLSNDRLSDLQESVFAIIFEEAATNIMRHAQATSCHVMLQSAEGALQLVVEDDGLGAEAYDGFGLRGMRERLGLLGGSLEVTANRGTRLVASLPC